MKKVTTVVHCDVCNSTKNVKEEVRVQVIFTTEQNYGRTITPYLTSDFHKLDLCEICLDTIIEDGKYLYGSGAMGYNKYEFKIG